MTLSIGFHGAAGTVTGSKYLVDTGEERVLIDCGMFQGLRELRERNWEPAPFPPNSPGAVLLTHAHIDHIGWLPRLVKDGYRGPVYCTPATAEMARILLLDSARLHEEDADYANRKGYSRHKPALPLYTERDVQKTMTLFRPVRFRKELELGHGLTARFRNAGHILGSASVELTQERPGQDPVRIVFSGDLGRYHAPLHSDPDPLPECDAVVLESTYGDRSHEAEPIAAQIQRTFAAAIERKGIILIPAFAVARAQLVTLILRTLIATGKLPEIPIHVDSPMASDVTALYNHYLESESLDQEIPHTSPTSLFPSNVRFHRTVEESKQLNNLGGPRIIISSSGMLAGGRVLHHLQRLAGDPRNLIVLVGYQAPGTRGRTLADGERTVRMYGMDIPVFAEVRQLHGLSAHADRAELLRWVETAPRPPKTVFLTHGEPESSAALAAAVAEKFGVETIVPRMGDTYDMA